MSSTDSPPCDVDGLSRGFLLLDVQRALEGDGVLDRGAHGVLEILGPAVERRTMEKNRSRDVEVIAQRMEAMEVVHAVGHGVGERVFLRVDRAGLDHLDRLGEVHAHRRRAQQFERSFLHLARQHTDAQPLKSAGARTGRTRFEMWRKPFSNQPRMR